MLSVFSRVLHGRGCERRHQDGHSCCSESGDFKFGRLDGPKGVWLQANGDLYRGVFKGGLMEGEGLVKFANGDVYQGEFKQDKFHGQGTMTWDDGDAYKGQWKGGCRHGHGTMTFADGRRKPMKGKWLNDKFPAY